jgi:hypothetical protein
MKTQSTLQFIIYRLHIEYYCVEMARKVPAECLSQVLHSILDSVKTNVVVCILN